MWRTELCRIKEDVFLCCGTLRLSCKTTHATDFPQFSVKTAKIPLKRTCHHGHMFVRISTVLGLYSACLLDFFSPFGWPVPWSKYERSYYSLSLVLCSPHQSSH